MLALLAFAGVPALAQAECTESGCKQYNVEIPNSGAENKTQHPNSGGGTGPEAEASKKPAAHTEGSQSPQSGSNESSENKGGGVSGGGNEGGSNNNGGSSNGGNKQAAEGKTGLEEEKPVSGTNQGEPISHSSGGSSPLVPILIVVAVLAAISIGAVIYRQRRQGSGGSGSPVSPKAG